MYLRSGMILAFAIGWIVSSVTKDWMWFARSGSVVVALSILLFVDAYSLDFRNSWSDAHNTINKVDEDIRDRFNERIAEDKMDRIWQSYSIYNGAAWSAFFGTVIWGFGDLLGKLF